MEKNIFEFYMKIAKGKAGIKIKAKKKTLTGSPSLKRKNGELNKQEEKQ